MNLVLMHPIRNAFLFSDTFLVVLSTPRYFTAAFLTQTVQLDDATVKFEIW